MKEHLSSPASPYSGGLEKTLCYKGRCLNLTVGGLLMLLLILDHFENYSCLCSGISEENLIRLWFQAQAPLSTHWVRLLTSMDSGAWLTLLSDMQWTEIHCNIFFTNKAFSSSSVEFSGIIWEFHIHLLIMYQAQFTTKVHRYSVGREVYCLLFEWWFVCQLLDFISMCICTL